MSRPRTSTAERLIPEGVTPELMLRKATLARSSGLRAKYARRGLEHDGNVDRTTRAMLLRQLYLSHMEARRFNEALDVAEEMVQTGIMPDVARQDAARACLGLGSRDQAIEHLRLASRVSPPSRRAFHLWTLGSVLHLTAGIAMPSVRSRALRAGARPTSRSTRASSRSRASQRVIRCAIWTSFANAWRTRPAGRATGSTCSASSHSRRVTWTPRGAISEPS